MAGANMKAIKIRIHSVRNTMQITKAMELVAVSKLRRAKEMEENALPYSRLLSEAIAGIMVENREKCAFFRGDARTSDPDRQRTCFLVIAGDRGLAGGYNSNLFRLVRGEILPGDVVFPIGKKTLEYYRKQPFEILSDDYPLTSEIGILEAFEIGEAICGAFLAGRFDRVRIAYTRFVNMLSQTPRLEDLLPLERSSFEHPEGTPPYQSVLYDPSPDVVLGTIIPQYVSGILYGAVCEAEASEFAARRNSMSAANKNAGEMIDTLTLHYNRARQAIITQEITEIVAGSGSG